MSCFFDCPRAFKPYFNRPLIFRLLLPKLSQGRTTRASLESVILDSLKKGSSFLLSPKFPKGVGQICQRSFNSKASFCAWRYGKYNHGHVLLTFGFLQHLGCRAFQVQHALWSVHSCQGDVTLFSMEEVEPLHFRTHQSTQRMLGVTHTRLSRVPTGYFALHIYISRLTRVARE